MLQADMGVQGAAGWAGEASALGRADLRRRMTPAMAERVVMRLEHLPEVDRAILRSVFVDHRTVKDLAPMSGYSAKVLRRRVSRTVKRVLGPRFGFVLERRGSWTPTRRRVATLCFIDGRSVREVATELGLSLHAVRRHREAIEALFGEQRPPSRAAANHTGGR